MDAASPSPSCKCDMQGDDFGEIVMASNRRLASHLVQARSQASSVMAAWRSAS